MKKYNCFLLKNLMLVFFFFTLLIIIGCTPTTSQIPQPEAETIIEKIIQPGSVEGKDSFAFEGHSGDRGDYVSLMIGTDNYHHYNRAYLQFNIGSIPQNAIVTEAKLGLYFHEKYDSGGYNHVSVYQVNGPWEENIVSWLYQPAFSTVAIDTQEPGFFGDTGKFVYWNILNIVQGWVNGSVINYGVMLTNTDESQRGCRGFYSSDWTSPNPRPKLIIKYYISQD